MGINNQHIHCWVGPILNKKQVQPILDRLPVKLTESLSSKGPTTIHQASNSLAWRYACVQQLFKCPIEKIQFKVSEKGKPLLFIGSNEWFISISHTRKWLAIAISDTPIGIDIERTNRPISDALIDRYVDPGISKPLSHDDKLKLWTQWEAYCKATGTGLVFPIQRLAQNQVRHLALSNLVGSLASTHSISEHTIQLNQSGWPDSAALGPHDSLQSSH